MTSHQTDKFKAHLRMKYFPKYLRNSLLSSPPNSIQYQVKKNQSIRNFIASPLYKSPEWKLLLNNKTKNPQGFYNRIQSQKQLFKMIKFFTDLTFIKFSCPKESPNSLKIKKSLENLRIGSGRKMECLKKLKTLSLNRLSKYTSSLLYKLDRSQRFLNSLKALMHSYKLKSHQEIETLEIMKDCKSILASMTTLSLKALCSPSHHKIFKKLENLCPNLRQLSLEFSCRKIIYPPMKARIFFSQSFQVEINYLSVIKTFKNLISLELNIADTFTFLKDFAVPPLIKDLLLNFEECLSEEILCKIGNTFTDLQALKFFEENQTLVQFYDNFKHLYDLKTLTIFYSDQCDPEDYKYQNYLLKQILKKIPSIIDITFIGWASCRGLNKRFFDPVQDFYFPQLLQSCHHSSETLQSLGIGGEKIIFSNLDLSSLRNRFTNLSRIKITGRINNPNIDIEPFLAQILSLGDSITNIKLNTFLNETIESLVFLLRQLSQLDKPSKVELEIQIKFLDTEKLEISGVNFENLIKEIQKTQGKLHGVSLEIQMPQKNQEYFEAFFQVYGKRFERFSVPSGYTHFYSLDFD